VITPDDKDWTWVIDRPCEECGFDTSTLPPELVAGLLRENISIWQRLFDRGVIGPGRPDDRTWSSLEYAAHVRDVFIRYRERVVVMVLESDPLYANWDQDATAIDDRYEEQNPAEVIAELTAAGNALAVMLDGVRGDAWKRPGRRSDGATFTISSLVRYMLHDAVHHIWDVTRPRP
jgi:hypothetical protein